MLIVGICLIIIATPSEKHEIGENSINNKNNKNARFNKEYAKDMDSIKKESSKNDKEYVKEQEERLQKILESMRYIESAKVMITLKSSKEEIVLKNNPYTKEENEYDATYESDEEAVLIEDSQGNAKPYVLKEINPQIEGIVVVVKTQLYDMEREIKDIVLALFDVPAHKIKVMNMK